MVQIWKRKPLSPSGSERTVFLSFDPLGLDVEVSLEPMFEWWDWLQQRNRQSREADEFGRPLGGVRFIRRCTNCGADFSNISFVERVDCTLRVCRLCKGEMLASD